ncbi:4-diphosphocytidyl-2-C-methyl-D-erythritol kinase [Dunaliella salina]|uniref:4-diphosphocytidyl-2-C-methyl-D-erythritol kinase n=1 Tax=Dunaliella salina TaxID=3046 RepID=A0ABQ7GZK4_DUNSA|nr:4-diphosphocytidyl-2-C-methyl-D-erythritol kinase [Dunaliella salina]|eukprot:KAF5840037.1 4-diphosphocytidyl-2-C-methyl-D-erythritol kinase [Dunaliella salina]
MQGFARAYPSSCTQRKVLSSKGCSNSFLPASWRKVGVHRPVQSVAAAPASSLEKQVSLFSPSKVNLFLRVVRRREDGYHDLASLFHVIDLGDDMDFGLLPEGATSETLECSDPTVPTNDSNLVIKALNLFREKTGIKRFFYVNLDKKVPHGAGLGGGSGNAATTLWAANELLGRPATTAQLLKWSGDIGSDISVFFSHGAAFCTGRGEIVEDVAPPLPLTTPLLLVKPPLGLSTPTIFKSLDLARRSQRDPRELLASMTEAGQKGVRALQEFCVNDLEQPAFDNLPQLAQLKTEIGHALDSSAVFMTGSGSTIVAVGSDTAPACLLDPKHKDLFISPARLITRKSGEWYKPSGMWSSSPQ